MLLFLGSVCGPVQDEAQRELLRVLSAAAGSGRGLRDLRLLLDHPVARRFRVGWNAPAVQLAPRPDGDGPGRVLRLW